MLDLTWVWTPSKAGYPPIGYSPIGFQLKRHHARADEVGQGRALLARQERVDLAQRLGHRVAQPLGALDAQRARLVGLGLVERVARHRVGEPGDGAPPVDLGLRALGLQLLKDARQLADLFLVELELVGEEAQGAPHAELAAAVVLAARGLARPLARIAAAPAAVAAVLVVTAATAAAGPRAFATAVMAVLPPIHHAWMHSSPPLPGRIAPGGSMACGKNSSHVISSESAAGGLSI